MGASMGVVLSTDERNSMDAMMRDADAAMFRAKHSGGGRYEVFERGSEIQAPAGVQRQRQLRQALDKHEFELWYQPMFRLATGQVEGFEAVPRWRRADGSIDTLRDLQPIAEDSGFAVSVGRDFLEKVCRQLYSWTESMPGACPFLSVDLTRRQFYQDDLVAQVKTILIATGADPSRLMFEVPESVVSDNPDRAVAILQRLVDCGVRVALDHFGAGLAPVNHLVRLPLDLVKLDPSLTIMAGEPGRHVALLESLIHIANSVGVQLLAQGVQTPQQLSMLRELGCELGQGQLLSSALEPVNALQLAASTRPTMALNA
jgi:EAL domain-containing protein (putative c-di-GMP-specific phosphodiesterase class I)